MDCSQRRRCALKLPFTHKQPQHNRAVLEINLPYSILFFPVLFFPVLSCPVLSCTITIGYCVRLYVSVRFLSFYHLLHSVSGLFISQFFRSVNEFCLYYVRLSLGSRSERPYVRLSVLPVGCRSVSPSARPIVGRSLSVDCSSYRIACSLSLLTSRHQSPLVRARTAFDL